MVNLYDPNSPTSLNARCGISLNQWESLNVQEQRKSERDYMKELSASASEYAKNLIAVLERAHKATGKSKLRFGPPSLTS
jgi:hypothetical protein